MIKKTRLATLATTLFGAAAFVAPLFAEAPQTSATQPAPDEIRVVYPASATSTEPIVFEPRDVVPPRSESRDSPFGSDVETPIGQVRAVLATLDEVRRSQAELAAQLAALPQTARFDPAVLTGPLETLKTRLDAQFAALETALAERDATNAATLSALAALPTTLATDFEALGTRFDALSETLASQPLPPEPQAPHGWTFVLALTTATCLVVLGRVACSGVAAAWRFASARREEAFAARLAEFEAARQPKTPS